MNFRIGFGYDVHQLVSGRDFWLGGIKIPFEKGGLGHSDADVLIHVICDALLGAANLGDIGKHFPDKSRSMATGIVTAAASVGYFLSPLFMIGFHGKPTNKFDKK